MSGWGREAAAWAAAKGCRDPLAVECYCAACAVGGAVVVGHGVWRRFTCPQCGGEVIGGDCTLCGWPAAPAACLEPVCLGALACALGGRR
jgi:predicted RNA-binding Zn-ribbon protein involved in translation (DUF1610 family)